MIEVFHLLRPYWLAAAPVVIVLWWLLKRRQLSPQINVAGMAPHLVDALTVGGGRNLGIKPIDTIAVGMLLGIFAMSGPTWEQEPSPWYTESAPLVIAIEVTDSMRANDIQPTRLDRVRFKLLDLLAERAGARTALIAYAGSAHVVIPPTQDEAVLKMFLENLDPAVMPMSGQSLNGVLPLAANLLSNSLHAGTLLVVTDGIDAVDIPVLQQFGENPDAPGVVFYLAGTEEGGIALYPDGSIARTDNGLPVDSRVDVNRMQDSANRLDIPLVLLEVTSNDDLDRLLRQINASASAADDPNAVWVDEAWWLVWPLLLLTLLSFRRGWVL